MKMLLLLKHLDSSNRWKCCWCCLWRIWCRNNDWNWDHFIAWSCNYPKFWQPRKHGCAVSYPWVGVHAISDNWNFFGLEILPFEDELLLFLLMVCVTATNSTMAAMFVNKDNWFSDAFKSLGLGKPGCGRCLSD